MMQLTNFQKALHQLGANDDERGQKLGVDDRTIRFWRARVPRIIRIIASNPDLAAALAEDARCAVANPDPDKSDA